VSNDGDVVVFTTGSALTADAHDNSGEGHLYRLSVASGRLETLTAGVGTDVPGAPPGSFRVGVPAISDDADTVYFTAGSPTLSVVPLYVSRHDQTKRIAVMTNGDAPLAQSGAQASPSGRYLVFTARTRLAAAAGGAAGQVQRYLFDAETGRATCVSCDADGRPTVGVDDFIGYRQGFEQRRAHYVLDDGTTFVETTDALLPQDTNGRRDVYAWRDGRIRLISPGTGQYGATFVDASPDGRDVFIATRDQLATQDRDDLVDVYDARVDGGFASSGNGPGAPCTGDSCQSEPTPPPSLDLAGSTDFSGSGNVLAPSSSPRSIKLSVSSTAALAGGRMRIVVRLPAAGRLAISGSGLAKSARVISGRGAAAMTVSLTKSARQKLARKRKLLVRATLRFTPVGGKPLSLQRQLTFTTPSQRKGR
jgi:Tol biopolymer transport system component